MTASDTPNSATERKRAERLDVARTAYHALALQDANRVITLCDIRGRLIALAYRSKTGRKPRVDKPFARSNLHPPRTQFSSHSC
jgi:hypothetical protein